MNDKLYGINAQLADSLKLEQPLLDIDRLVRAKDPTELLVVIYPEVKRIRSKYKDRPACSRTLTTYAMTSTIYASKSCSALTITAARRVRRCQARRTYRIVYERRSTRLCAY